jgi:predicted RNA-binding Zn-ribbon protein involved in translation (DUF1610 family)
MSASELKVIKLGCVSCGANLEISQQMNRLACGFCGTQQVVERSGGAIHLRGVSEAIAKVQVGTDKTAAELAIVRLTKELENCKAHRSAEANKLRQIRSSKVNNWNYFLEKKRNSVTIIIGIVTFIAAIPIGVGCNVIVYGILSLISQGGGAFVAFAAFVASCILVAVVTKDILYKNDKFNPKKLKSDYTKDIANFDKVAAQSLSPYDKEISALNAKIRQNYEIANS